MWMGKASSTSSLASVGARRLNLANLGRRVIVLRVRNTAQRFVNRSYSKDWKAFRTSLATNLLSCGVDAKVIQAILRHSDIATTLSFYTQVPDADARRALQKIEDLLLGAEGDKLKMSEPT